MKKDKNEWFLDLKKVFYALMYSQDEDQWTDRQLKLFNKLEDLLDEAMGDD